MDRDTNNQHPIMNYSTTDNKIQFLLQFWWRQFLHLGAATNGRGRQRHKRSHDYHRWRRCIGATVRSARPLRLRGSFANDGGSGLAAAVEMTTTTMFIAAAGARVVTAAVPNAASLGLKLAIMMVCVVVVWWKVFGSRVAWPGLSESPTVRVWIFWARLHPFGKSMPI